MSKLANLKERAAMLRRARSFFEDRQVLEVDVPLMSTRASIDAHIDLVPAVYAGSTACYLHSSPEFGMKRLLCEGIGDIFQLSHVFRDGELGSRHNPEFMMAEWYRINMPFASIIEETLDFIRLFLGPLPSQQVSYRELIVSKTGIDPFIASKEEVLSYLKDNNAPLYNGIEEEGKDELLMHLLSTFIEPNLGKDSLFVLSHYPATQAALAKTLPDGSAERFEIYYRGIELANGYHELADPIEQERRFHASNQERIAMGKKTLPIDTLFLEALNRGLPPCSGVAVGFDRLMMLKLNAPNIAAVMPFPFPLA